MSSGSKRKRTSAKKKATQSLETVVSEIDSNSNAADVQPTKRVCRSKRAKAPKAMDKECKQASAFTTAEHASGSKAFYLIRSIPRLDPELKTETETAAREFKQNIDDALNQMIATVARFNESVRLASTQSTSDTKASSLKSMKEDYSIKEESANQALVELTASITSINKLCINKGRNALWALVKLLPVKCIDGKAKCIRGKHCPNDPPKTGCAVCEWTNLGSQRASESFFFNYFAQDPNSTNRKVKALIESLKTCDVKEFGRTIVMLHAFRVELNDFYNHAMGNDLDSWKDQEY